MANEDKLLVSSENSDDTVSRRDLLKMAGTAIGVAATLSIANIPASSPHSHSEGGIHSWGMLIDIDLCIGCNYCTYACQAVNNLVDEMIYNVVTVETTQTGDEYYLSRPCMHCDEPPCVHVCPVGATYKRDDGIITMDYDRCIGCRYCQVACPYDVRVFNWRDYTKTTSPRVPDFGIPEVEPRVRGVMEKCTFCEHRVDAGLERGLVPGVDLAATPACVVACPTGARVFGDIKDESSPISQTLKNSRPAIRLRENLSTSPKVFYLPPKEA